MANLPLDPPPAAGSILIPTSIGSQVEATTIEGILAAALRLRGAHVDVLLCDAALPACHACTLQGMGNVKQMAVQGPRKLYCPGCFESGAKMYAELGIRALRYSDFLRDDDRRKARDMSRSIPWEQIPDLRLANIAIGEHAMAGTLRFFARATVNNDSAADAVARRFVEAAYLTACAATRLFGERSYQRAVFHHGIYVPQGVIGEVARSCDVPVVNWSPAYRSGRFLFSHGDSYHKTMITEPTAIWEDLALTPTQDSCLEEYLRSRWSGANDWISFSRSAESTSQDLFTAVGLDPLLPVIGMLTNVLWDAQLHYPANAFSNMLEWCLGTIKYFRSRPDLQLLIRVHPAELTGMVKSRQPVVEEIARAMPELPPNVFVIGPDSPLSTYGLMAGCDSVIIYGTKTGVELSAVGIPVVVAGEAWIRNKGLTIDASTREQYTDILDTLPLGRRLDMATVERARKYAYHFFFRRMIPLDFVAPGGTRSLLRSSLTDLSQLEPGSSPGLDAICSGILNGAPFVYEGDK